MNLVRFAAPVALVWLVATAVAAQSDPQQPPPPASVFRSGTDTVSLSVTVLDAQGRHVSGLTKDDFQVFEDFVPQRLRVQIEANESVLRSGQTRPINVQADFLYGAPGAGLAVEGEGRLMIDPTPFPDFAEYSFGRLDESFSEQFFQLAPTVTDGQGRARFPMRPGAWMLNVVWSNPSERDPRADFETIFSSLTFGP